MKTEVKFRPSATTVICGLGSSDILRAESGAFIAAQGSVNIETSTYQRKSGGIWAGIKRLVSGESFFINKFSTKSDMAQVWLGTPLPGDIAVHELKGEKLIVSGGSYLASTDGVEIDFQWQGLKSVFSGENLFWIQAKGQGTLILSSFGFIYPLRVDGEMIVDTGHIVAFEETLSFSISKSTTSWIGAFLSGEGFVCRFKGKGVVWCQSHNPNSFGSELTPYLRPRKS
jgi:uncharacterized protein (TIGR00266 family)